jgi:polysaccharide biosynthesis transport protein
MASSRRATDMVAPRANGDVVGQYRNLLRRRWRYPATIIPAAALLAIFIAYVLPVSYRAGGTIMLQPSSIPTEMISSTVRRREDAPYDTAQQELELVRRRVMTPDRLRQLVREVDPYPDTPSLSLDAKAQRVAESVSVERVDPITLKPLDESTAFSVYYDNPRPDLAARVASKLMDLYLTYNRATRTEEAEAAYEFLQSQAKDLEASMVEQESKLAEFKAKFGNSLPEMQQHNLSEIDRTQHDLDGTQRELLLAEEKESQLQLQLNDLSPSLAAGVNDTRTQLAKLRAELADAQLKYTPQHPEVKRLNRAIAEMISKNAANTQQSGETPDNPEYLSVASQLAAARRAVGALRADEGRERAAISNYEKGLSTQPNVERAYTQLTRDYDNSRARYEDLQAKMKNAALARTMEAQAKGEKFELIHAASVPSRPFFPNRLGIILLGVVLSVVAALVCVAVVDSTDPTVRGTADLQQLAGETLLGSIPALLNPNDLRRRKVRWLSALTGYALATVIVAATVVLHR